MPDSITKQISQIMVETASGQRKDFRDENILMEVCCRAAPDLSVHRLAKDYGATFKGAPKSQNDVERVFKMWHIWPDERDEVFRLATENGIKIAGLIKNPDTKTLSDIMNTFGIHRQLKRLSFIAYMGANGADYPKEAYDSFIKMNRDFMNECVDSILNCITEAIGGKTTTPSKISGDHKKAGAAAPAIDQNTNQATASFTREEYEDEIRRLNASLTRANNLLTRLQESHDEQVADIRREEAEKLITLLNSPKYGHILDLLISAQVGFKKLQEKGPIPLEIKDVKTLLRRIREFVEDCGVEPTHPVGLKMSIKAADIDVFYYEGTPFSGPDEIKEVEIVSPGWAIPENDITISYPKVREITEEM